MNVFGKRNQVDGFDSDLQSFKNRERLQHRDCLEKEIRSTVLTLICNLSRSAGVDIHGGGFRKRNHLSCRRQAVASCISRRLRSNFMGVGQESLCSLVQVQARLLGCHRSNLTPSIARP